MDQNRLYYVTPYVKNFMCTVISCTQNKKGTWDAMISPLSSRQVKNLK